MEIEVTEYIFEHPHLLAFLHLTTHTALLHNEYIFLLFWAFASKNRFSTITFDNYVGGALRHFIILSPYWSPSFLFRLGHSKQYCQLS